MNTRLNLAGIAITLAMAASMPSAEASVLVVSNGGGHCDPSSGWNSSNFYTHNLYLENVGASSQYVTCILPMVRESLLNIPIGLTGYDLKVQFHSNGTGSGQVNCVAVMAYVGQNPATQTISAKSTSVPVGGSGSVAFSRIDLVIHDPFVPLTLNCLVPAGIRIGRIDQYQPELGILAVP